MNTLLKILLTICVATVIVTLPYCSGMYGVATSGRIIDAITGQGVPDAQVTLLYRAYIPLPHPGEVPLREISVQTDEIGEYHAGPWVGAMTTRVTLAHHLPWRHVAVAAPIY